MPGIVGPRPPRPLGLHGSRTGCPLAACQHALPGRWWARPGATAVEFAFVGPLFLLMVLGIFEWGRCFMVQALINEAAREGCRAGVVEGTTTAQIQSAATTYLTNMGISGDSASVLINGSTGTDASSVPAFTEITVEVTVPCDDVTWLPVGLMMYLPGIGSVNAGPRVTLTGQCTLRRE